MFSYLLDRYFIKQPRLRRFFTWLLAGNTEKEIQLCGTPLTVHTIKENGYLRAWRKVQNSTFLRDELAVLINLSMLLGPQDTFVDVGANIGVYCHTVARFRHLMPELRVYAFEANPDTYGRLVRSASTGIQSKQIALADHSGELEFVGGAVSHVFTTQQCSCRYNIPSERTLVRCCRLDECGIEGDSLVIKVDVEGQELQVLQGAMGLLKAERIKALYFDGYKDDHIPKILGEIGFQFFDGKTLQPATRPPFSLLAVNPRKCSGLEMQVSSLPNSTNEQEP